MALNKKPTTQTTNEAVDFLLSSCSKAALADALIDLVRGEVGVDEDGDALLHALEARLEPVLAARGDKLPKRLDVVRAARNKRRQ